MYIWYSKTMLKYSSHVHIVITQCYVYQINVSISFSVYLTLELQWIDLKNPVRLTREEVLSTLPAILFRWPLDA